MKFRKDIFKETCVIVFTGLALNYPINILVTWLLLDIFHLTSPIIIATLASAIFTVVAIGRVYSVRYYHETKKEGE